MATLQPKRPILTALLLVAGLLLCTAATADRLADGIAAYEAEDYERAYELLRPLAEEGDADAQYYVGRMYGFGRGVAKDVQRAFDLHHDAAGIGQTNSMRVLGYTYLNGVTAEGLTIEQDHEKAAYWYRKAAEAGDAKAQRSMGLLYKRGEGVERDYAQAMEWFRRGAEQGDAVSAYHVGKLYYDGLDPIELDYVRAAQWFHRAARAGHAHSQYILGSLHLQGLGVPGNSELAVVWYGLAARQGHQAATRNWERAHYFVREDRLEAIAQRVEQGDMPALVQ